MLTTLQTIAHNGYYRSQGWLAETQRIQFRLNPYRFPGAQPAIQLQHPLQDSVRIIRTQVAGVLGVCPCKFGDGTLLNIEPNQDVPAFHCQGGTLATIDLQTGDLWFSQDPLTLARSMWPDWQYYLQFTISA